MINKFFGVPLINQLISQNHAYCLHTFLHSLAWDCDRPGAPENQNKVDHPQFPKHALAIVLQARKLVMEPKRLHDASSWNARESLITWTSCARNTRRAERLASPACSIMETPFKPWPLFHDFLNINQYAFLLRPFQVARAPSITGDGH